MIVASLVCYDNTHKMVGDHYKKAQREVEGDWYVVDLQVVKIALETMKSDYLCFLYDRDYILKVAETYDDQWNRERNEIKELNKELKYVHKALDDTQFSLQEAKNQIRVTNHFWEHEGKESREFFQEVIEEHDSIQRTYDLDSCPKRPSTKDLDHIWLIDNSMFEVNADWTSDNPLFEINEGTPFGYREEDDSDFRILNPSVMSPSSQRHHFSW